ncbi:MAG: stress response translation initiation inhibitor YciH [Candidatus Omnitrophota bacterium]
MKYNDLSSRLVYSTDQGALCPECNQAINSCVCQDRKKASVPETDGVVRLRYEIKGRKGKGVTLVTGLALNEAGLLNLAKRFKQQFGTGGAVKDYTIALQGDFRKQATQELRKLGYRVK